MDKNIIYINKDSYDIILSLLRKVSNRGSPIPLLKTASRKSNWPIQASRKIRKTASRSLKKATNHVQVKMQRLNKSNSRCIKHI